MITGILTIDVTIKTEDIDKLEKAIHEAIENLDGVTNVITSDEDINND